MPGSAPEISIRPIFPRARRLRSGTEFRETARLGQRRRDEFFIIQSRPNTIGWARLGVTVSRRVALRANRRNRLKRLIRESFRVQSFTSCCLDIVVIAQPPADRAPAQQLRQALEVHWQAIREQCAKS